MEVESASVGEPKSQKPSTSSRVYKEDYWARSSLK